MQHAQGDFLLARPDVAVRARTDGAWIGNAGTSFTVQGRGAYDLVTAVLGALDGEHPAADLVARFPSAVRPMVTRLAGTLVARGCAVRLATPLREQVAARGAAAAWLIPSFAQFTTDPVAALDTVCAGPVVLYGRPGWLDRLRTLLDAAPLHGFLVDYRTTGHPLPDGEPGLVVVDADGLPHERAVTVADTLRARGVPHAVAGEVAGLYWIVWSPGCWACLSRCAAILPGGAAPAAELTAPVLAELMYQRCAGLGEPDAVSIAAPDGLPTVTRHPVLTTSGCRCHRAVVRGGQAAATDLVRPNVVRPDDDPALHAEHDRILAALTGWTDRLAGPVLGIDGDHLAQIPFGTAEARIVDGRAAVRTVRAATLSSREAFYQAALNGFERFAEPSPSGTRGAGWTRDEAVYRALLRAALREPPPDLAPITDADLGDEARYVARAMDDARTWTGARLPNGLHYVIGIGPAGAPAHGAGTSYGEAVAMALLRLVNDADVLTHLNPQHRTWTEVWERITYPERVTVLPIPFAHNEVQLVEVNR